jgi:hypothetical protein
MSPARQPRLPNRNHPSNSVPVTRVVLFCALLTLAWTTSATEQEHWRAIKGAALHDLFKDKEYADGVHFAYQFKADGTFTGTEMMKTVSGSWHVRQDRLCWAWQQPPGPQECYDVQQDGMHVRLLVNGSEAWYGTLEKLR